MSDPMDCSDVAGSSVKDGSGMGVLATQKADLIRKLEQLESGLGDEHKVWDRSGLRKIAVNVREEFQTCMRPFTSCQEAFMEIREISRRL
jgi:hypothetical protein